MFLRDNLIPDFARIAVRDPIELGHQFHRPDLRRGISVAGQAERHVERLFLVHFDLLIDAPVAAHAAHAHAGYAPGD